MRKNTWALLCIAFLSCSLYAQTITFTATANAKQVTTRSIFQVTFALQNAKGKDFRPPDFKEFDFVTGPSQSMSTSIYNGAMTQSLSYTYSLMRIKPGTVTIAPATIKAGSQLLKSNPVSVTIVEGKPSVPGDDPATAHNVYLRAVMSDKPVYPGQQIKLDYKVYTTVNIRNYNTINEDDYAQFYYRYIQNFNNRATQEVVDGVQYTVQTVKSIALFPQQVGNYSIAPMVVTLGVTLKGERPSLFFGSRSAPVTVASDSIKIKVLPLPADAPPRFTGAVGHYSVQAQINKQQLTTDDALVLTLHFIGDGDSKRWSPPDLTRFQNDFELYDPKILKDESVDENGAIRHRRTIEYVMIPRRTGEQSLQIDFTYFDPDSAAYRTVSTPAYKLTVLEGTRKSRGDQVFTTDVASMEPRGLKPMRAAPRGVFLFSPLYFTLMLLPVLGLAGVWWLKRKEYLFEALDPVEKKRRRARKLAERYLQEALQNVGGTARAYYDSISRAIFSYLTAKLNIPNSELTKANIAAHLDKLALPTELKKEIMQILITSEQVLYAGGTTNADRQQMYDRTLALIEAVESNQLQIG